MVSACLSEESPRIYVPSEVFSLNEQNPFSVNLRTAKETQGLEKMVIATASRDKNRLKKSRPRRTTSNSAGGGI